MRLLELFSHRPGSRGSHGKPSTPASQPRPSGLGIEALEDRCLLSAGSLDPTFGNGGIASVPGPTGGAIALQSDGKIVQVVGSTTQDHLDTVLGITRFNPDGSHDTTFGDNGITLKNLVKRTGTTSGPGREGASTATVRPDGDIVVAGFVVDSSNRSRGLLAQFNPDGTFDTTFGDWNKNPGTTITRFAASFVGMKILDDGGIIAVGSFGSGAEQDVLVARFTVDGRLDPTFGGGDGYVTTDLGGADRVTAVSLTSGGQILVAGGQYQDLTGQFLLRYDPDGTLDPTFGVNGIVHTQVFQTVNGGEEQVLDRASSLSVTPEGDIFVAGSADDHHPTIVINALALSKYDPEGTLDTSFGTNGVVILSLPSSRTGSGLADIMEHSVTTLVDQNGKLVVRVDLAGSVGRDITLLRYHPDGSLDESFGTDGIASFDRQESDLGTSITEQPDGKLLIGATLAFGDNENQAFGVLRLLVDPPPPPTPGITVTPTSGLETTESGGTASFVVVLDAEPTADVTVGISSLDQTEGTVTVSSVTFTPSTWNLPQTVTITGVDDALIDGDIVYTIATAPAISTDPDYSGLDAADVSVTNIDDDAPSSSNGIYVWDIVFESRDRGSKHDERIAVVIREDSDGDGIPETSDAVVAGASVTVVLTGPLGGTFTGSTDSNGLFRTDWMRDVPSGTYTAEVTSLTHSTLTWDQSLDPTANDTDIDGDNLPDQQHSNPEAHNLLSQTLGNNPDAAPLTLSQVEPLLQEALSRLSESGYSVEELAEIQVVITDLPGTTLGQAVGQTIYLDINAANWGWFVDATPGDDGEFSTPGDQGEQGHIDLLTTLMHELGHLFGHDHADEGLMQQTLAPGVRLNPTPESELEAARDWFTGSGTAEGFVSDWVFALLARDARAAKV
jgi:uncharacterized delta-60 repeat protein